MKKDYEKRQVDLNYQSQVFKCEFKLCEFKSQSRNEKVEQQHIKITYKNEDSQTQCIKILG